MRVVYWGTYDTGKPRNRIMIRGLRENGVQVIECHANIWEGLEDKSQLSGIRPKVRPILRLFLAYPMLVCRYLRLPTHDIVVVGYMGQFDVLLIWLFAHLRRVPICWDVFLSLYDTVVLDRKMTGKSSAKAFFLYLLEWLGSKAADRLLMDTRVHARYFQDLYRLSRKKVHHVYVGTEREIFNKRPSSAKSEGAFTILFYGQFIPLHGIDTIVEAAAISERSGEHFRWIIIGEGQESLRIDRLIKRLGVKSIDRISWVPYEKLVDYINQADVCLGVFGTSGKALRVIPNKVYQILAVGKPLITADGPAIRELLDDSNIVRLIPPGDSTALANTLLDMRKVLTCDAELSKHPNELPIISYHEIGASLLNELKFCLPGEQDNPCAA